MEKRAKRNNEGRPGRSLSLILWCVFSLFALLVVVVFVLVQNALVVRQFRENTFKILREANERMSAEIVASQSSSQLERRLINIANDYGLTVALFYEDGESVYPLTEQTDYGALAASLREQRDAGRMSTFLISERDGQVALASATAVGGQPAFLYLSASMQGNLDLESGLKWMSVITALVAVVLAFVVSGFVSASVTRPVTEVTARAQELARGNYQISFRKDYYCAEIRELSDALDHARVEISKADKMQKELIANVSHDFKTPLTMIKAYASMIREISGDDKTKRDKHAQVIIDEADRLAALVGDVLDLSKLQAGIEKEEFSVFNLSEDVYAVTNRFDFYVETEGCTIHTDIDDDLYTFAARGRVEQVLYNLIGNAISYTGADKSILVRLKAGKDCSHFEVIDTGKGIPKEELDTIWDRYYRSTEAHKRLKRGTGLGLSIVKSILVKYGIRFGVRSEVGKGSCFWVDFPLPNGRENKTK